MEHFPYALLDENNGIIDKKAYDIESFYDSDFHQRIMAQQRRIDQRIATRSLTRREGAIVRGNLDWIKDRFAQIRGGMVPPKV